MPMARVATLGSLHVISALGHATFPLESTKPTELMDKAHASLHRLHGTVYRSFHETTADRFLARQQMGLANYLRNAIRENKLRLAFQPIINARDGSISHYEALLRLIG